ncbi:MAG: hypothetical protein COT31_04680, partial [Candidatus Moranbacteria bacterium CG08_land_8_20_14_0_20_34_16]
MKIENVSQNKNLPKSKEKLLQKEIDALKEKIKNINEDEQKSRGYKIKDKRGSEISVDPDRNKMTIDLENRIRQLERDKSNLWRKERIEQLKKEILELNKKEQEAYKMENYKVKDRGGVNMDREKMVLEKEDEIRRLEREINSVSKVSSFKNVPKDKKMEFDLTTSAGRQKFID